MKKISKLQRIRKRSSYQRFKAFYNEISACCMDNEKDRKRVMLSLWSLLDRYMAFGSETNSYYAKESILQLLKDINF